ncbi:hypothetical protein F9C07_9213 [Aspergillus flavus]|uniref:HTH psq-type domain-containing protein n=1 Tax=Aspergillus flavus (strain ATCC 200026 / FGSC A1120 / IAM 13836 / NRRL 3357 / JCM 12722 / SRRC 167) TaxID=332952 RepID=A0A7U2MJM7_ASPFN|nr:hypothetical protein F9C07_9213 [Aspergillus flavus]
MEEQERKIQAAISDVKEGKFSSVREAARKYGVPSTTLRNRMNGVTFRPKKWANCHRMTQEEEDALVQWTLSAIERNQTAPSRAQVEAMANTILAKRGTPINETVGGTWVYMFLVYDTVVGSANAENGSPSANPDSETGQPGPQRLALPPPRGHSTHPYLEATENLKRLETLLSTFKELETEQSETGSSSTQTAVDKLIKGCEMIVESGYSLLKENRDLRAALAEKS